MDDRPEARDVEAMRQIMEQAQDGAPDSGRHFLLWGVVTVAGLLGTYANLNGSRATVGAIWGVSIAIGWLAAMWIGYRERRRARVRNLLSGVLAGIWIGTGISATLATAAGLYLRLIAPEALPGVICIVLGGGFFASSFAYRSLWLRAVAFGWWGGGVAMLVWPGAYTLLLMTGMVIAFDIVPGALLYRRASASRAAAAE